MRGSDSEAVETMNRLLEEAGSDYRVLHPTSGMSFQEVIGSMMLALAKLSEAHFGSKSP